MASGGIVHVPPAAVIPSTIVGRATDGARRSAAGRTSSRRVTCGVADRLDAFLAHAGLGSRSDVKRLIRKGRVTVDGAEVRDASTSVRGRTVACDGVVVIAPRRNVVLVVHKPTGVSCSHDAREAPLVFDLVPDDYRATDLECVGRLDRETSGLLLLTDDGALNHRLAAPRRAVVKRYRVEYVGRLPTDAVPRFAAGLTLHGEQEPTLPAALRVESESLDGRPGRATVEIREGRYRQVRRMFAALGSEVVALKRDRIGAFDLPPDLAEGEAREATPDEIAAASRAPDDPISAA